MTTTLAAILGCWIALNILVAWLLWKKPLRTHRWRR